MIRAGQLRDRVLVQSRTDVKDSAGGFSPVWRDVDKEWVDAQPMIGGGGSELVVGDVLIAVTMYRVTMRFRTDITVQHRLLLIDPPNADLPLNILSINDPDGKKNHLILVCQSGETSG